MPTLTLRLRSGLREDNYALNQRWKELREKFTEKKLDALLISSPSNIFYLTSLGRPQDQFRSAQIFITKNKIYFLTNSLYAPAIKNWWQKNKRLIEGVSGAAGKVRALQGPLAEVLARICQEMRLENLGLEADDLKLNEYLKLRRALPKINLAPADEILTKMRMIKDEAEIEKIRKAANITDETFDRILPMIKQEMTEKEIAHEIDNLLIKNGADEAAYPTIVGSGANSCVPHHQTSSKKIKNGEIILLDFGARYQGYCSDMTRIISLGKPKREITAVYKKVLTAQKLALEKIGPGKLGKEVDQVARDYLKKHNLSRYFDHSLGHSLGLEIHEIPGLSPGETTALKAGMVVTVEPGVYLPGAFGIRIEDCVVIRENGAENLTHSPKELIEL